MVKIIIECIIYISFYNSVNFTLIYAFFVLDYDFIYWSFLINLEHCVGFRFRAKNLRTSSFVLVIKMNEKLWNPKICWLKSGACLGIQGPLFSNFEFWPVRLCLFNVLSFFPSVIGLGQRCSEEMIKL